MLLIVNTASKCAFTPQYAGLEELHRAYRRARLRGPGFPCNQFGAQEPGNAAEIGGFCDHALRCEFSDVREGGRERKKRAPLFQALKRGKPGLFGTEAIKWNFTKFLVDRDGHIADRFAPFVKPELLRGEIERLLG